MKEVIYRCDRCNEIISREDAASPIQVPRITCNWAKDGRGIKLLSFTTIKTLPTQVCPNCRLIIAGLFPEVEK